MKNQFTQYLQAPVLDLLGALSIGTHKHSTHRPGGGTKGQRCEAVGSYQSLQKALNLVGQAFLYFITGFPRGEHRGSRHRFL